MRIISMNTDADICYEECTLRIIAFSNQADKLMLRRYIHDGELLLMACCHDGANPICLATADDAGILQDIMRKIARSYKDGERMCIIPEHLRIKGGAML